MADPFNDLGDWAGLSAYESTQPGPDPWDGLPRSAPDAPRVRQLLQQDRHSYAMVRATRYWEPNLDLDTFLERSRGPWRFSIERVSHVGFVLVVAHSTVAVVVRPTKWLPVHTVGAARLVWFEGPRAPDVERRLQGLRLTIGGMANAQYLNA